jgi:hypothetical protein
MVDCAQKNRSLYVWAVKGFMGGPITVQQLTAITQQEMQDQLFGKDNQSGKSARNN